ncbi:hypothetical protein MA16_Dca025947 [Dendrobium catenatum]|uniref:Uncharacterized protein n=1 Tax=Dendrobium catenatum TaxID=906689 RepID=A0A2I0W4U1_9ASPA|nr:hypothetical protein MA16_Dca025947 [Dendrobium catenatum]
MRRPWKQACGGSGGKPVEFLAASVLLALTGKLQVCLGPTCQHFETLLANVPMAYLALLALARAWRNQMVCELLGDISKRLDREVYGSLYLLAGPSSSPRMSERGFSSSGRP